MAKSHSLLEASGPPSWLNKNAKPTHGFVLFFWTNPNERKNKILSLAPNFSSVFVTTQWKLFYCRSFLSQWVMNRIVADRKEVSKFFWQRRCYPTKVDLLISLCLEETKEGVFLWSWWSMQIQMFRKKGWLVANPMCYMRNNDENNKSKVFCFLAPP